MVLYYNHTLESPGKYFQKHPFPIPQNLIQYVWGGRWGIFIFLSHPRGFEYDYMVIRMCHEAGKGEV